MSSALWVVNDGSFYVGSWAVQDGSFYVGTWSVQLPAGSADMLLWLLPQKDENYTQTLSPEDLNALPENIDVFPEDTQIGDQQWTVQSFTGSNWYPLQGF